MYPQNRFPNTAQVVQTGSLNQVMYPQRIATNPMAGKIGSSNANRLKQPMLSEEDELLVTNEFETGFPDALEDICGVMSILPQEFANEYEEELEGEDCESDENPSWIDRPAQTQRVV